MATVTKSIGTASRDYSTITAWEADLGNTAIYAGGDDAVGECYNDSAFDESVRINIASSLPLASTFLKAASGESHDGTAGTGTRIVASVNRGKLVFLDVSGYLHKQKICDLELDGNGVNSNVCLSILSYATISNGAEASRMILHGASGGGFAIGVITQRSCDVINCVIYGNSQLGADIRPAATFPVNVLNCTVVGSIDAVYNLFDSSTVTIKNTIGADASRFDFNVATPANQTVSNNLSSDGRAPGTASLTNQSSADLFISIVPGSEDLHLKPGSPAIGAGANLGTSPVGVNFDIDNYDRSLAAAWDIGADQFVSGVNIWALLRRGNRMGHIGIQSSPNQHIARGIRMAQMGITL